MFMQLRTAKGERVIVNVNKILLIDETKKGATVVLENGLPILVSESLDELATRLNRRESPTFLSIETVQKLKESLK